MLDIRASFCAASLLAFLLLAPSRQAQMKTPPKAATAAMASVVPTMALERPISTLLEEELVDVAEADDVVDVEVVDEEEVLVADEVEVADDEVEEDVLVEVSEDVDEDEVEVADVVVLSSLVVVSARLLRAWNLRRSSPSKSGSSPDVGPIWHFSVIHSAFSASSVLQPAASRHVARSSTSTFSIAMHRVIIELSAHDRSDTMFARHPLLINREGAAVAEVVRSRAMATWARFSRMLKKAIVYLVWAVPLPDDGASGGGSFGLRDVGQLGCKIVETFVSTLAKQTSDN